MRPAQLTGSRTHCVAFTGMVSSTAGQHSSLRGCTGGHELGELKRSLERGEEHGAQGTGSRGTRGWLSELRLRKVGNCGGGSGGHVS